MKYAIILFMCMGFNFAAELANNGKGPASTPAAAPTAQFTGIQAFLPRPRKTDAEKRADTVLAWLNRPDSCAASIKISAAKDQSSNKIKITVNPNQGYPNIYIENAEYTLSENDVQKIPTWNDNPANFGYTYDIKATLTGGTNTSSTKVLRIIVARSPDYFGPFCSLVDR